MLADKHDDTGDAPEDLTDSLDTITERLSAIEDRLDEQELPPGSDPTPELEEHELRRLAFRVHDKLPVVQDETHLRSLIRADGPTIDVQSRPLLTGTAQDIAVAIDEPQHHVRSALIYIERQETEAVQSIIHDGTRRWFEKDETVDRDPPSSVEIEEEADRDKDDLEIIPATELDDREDRE